MFFFGGHVETQYTSHIRVLCITVPGFLTSMRILHTKVPGTAVFTTVDYENHGFHVIFTHIEHLA